MDDHHIIFFEQSLGDILGANGFEVGPGGSAYNDRQAYSYHIYCFPVDNVGFIVFVSSFQEWKSNIHRGMQSYNSN